MSDDTPQDAQQEAALSAAFYLRLLRDGVDERTARDMAVGYVIGRQRREKREPWDIGGESP